MCTISWKFAPSGFNLFFNRDEQRGRAPARPPETRIGDNGTSCLAPIDPEGGGSWIFVNEHGLAVALLNAYEYTESDQRLTDKPRSRGQLVLALAGMRQVEDFEIALQKEIQKFTYAPCFLCAFDNFGQQLIRLWDGCRLQAYAPRIPGFLSTSSFRSKEVVACREEAFIQSLGAPPFDPETMEAFHAGHYRPADAFNVCMSRADAKTVSVTHIRMTEDRKTLRYAPRNQDGAFALWTSFHLGPVERVANAPGNPKDPDGSPMK
jgi:hypothetical protein